MCICSLRPMSTCTQQESARVRTLKLVQAKSRADAYAVTCWRAPIELQITMQSKGVSWQYIRNWGRKSV